MLEKVLTTPRKTPRQARSRAIVKAILDATARILVKHGYEGASTNRIAEEAGVSIGSLYQYFPNKESLVVALIARQVERDRKTFETKVEGAADDPLEALTSKLIRSRFEALKKNRKLRRVLLQEVPRTGPFEKLLDVKEDVLPILLKRLKSDSDRVRRKNVELALFICFQGIDSVLHEIAVGGWRKVDEEELLGELSDLCLRYLLD